MSSSYLGDTSRLTLVRDAQTGANLVYTPESGISLNLLQQDVEFLKKRYAQDVPGKSEGRLVIR